MPPTNPFVETSRRDAQKRSPESGGFFSKLKEFWEDLKD